LTAGLLICAKRIIEIVAERKATQDCKTMGQKSEGEPRGHKKRRKDCFITCSVNFVLLMT
jgi:hypothetical protein